MPLRASRQAAALARPLGVDAVVVDCESGRMSLGLAARTGRRTCGPQYVKLAEVSAEALAGVAAAHGTCPSRTASRLSAA